jgi:hypothetical protein
MAKRGGAGLAFDHPGDAERGAGNSSARISQTPWRIAFQATLVGDIMAFA